MKTYLSILLLVLSLNGFSQCSPTLKELYDFEVGDHFIYENTDGYWKGNQFVIDYFYDSLFIVEDLTIGDTISYAVIKTKNRVDTIVIVDSVNHPLNLCDGELVNIWNSPFCIKPWDSAAWYLPLNVYSRSDESEASKSIAGAYFDNHYTKDSLGSLVPATNRDIQWIDQYYLPNKGNVYQQLVYRFLTGPDEYTRRVLIQHYRNGDTLEYRRFANAEELINHPKIDIYPNPARSQITVRSKNVIIREVQLIDGFGRLTNLSLINEKIDLSQIAAGFYLLRILTDDSIVVKKIAIE